MRPLEKFRVLAQCPCANVLERGNLLAELFVAPDKHLGIAKAQFANYFEEKCGLFEIRLNQKELQARMQNFEGKARKPGTSTRVGEPTMIDWHRNAGKHALAEVAIKDFEGIADGGQVDLVIPSQQDIYILLNLKHLLVIRWQV